MTTPEVLTVDEAAARFRVHPRTVRRLCNRGELPGAFRVGRQWRIPSAAADALTSPDPIDTAPERYGRGFAVAE